MAFKNRYTFIVPVTALCRVTVLGNDEDDAKERLRTGAWHGVEPDWNRAIAMTLQLQPPGVVPYSSKQVCTCLFSSGQDPSCQIHGVNK